MNINGIGNFTSDPFYVCPQGCAESKADVFGALTPEENLVFARESSVCKAAIARNIISGTTGGSFQMKKYKSDIGPIQSSYSNVEANEILGKSFKAQSIFFDFKEDGYECIPELVPDIRIESDAYSNSNITWTTTNGKPLRIEFETVHQLSRLVIEPIQGHDFIEQFAMEAFDDNVPISNFTFGQSSVYR